MANRAGFKSADLVIGITLPGEALVNTAHTRLKEMRVSTVHGVFAGDMIPMARVVGGQHDTNDTNEMQDKWFIPLLPDTDSIKVSSDGETRPLNLVKKPSVGTLASASSAAVGFAASPVDLALLAQQFQLAKATKSLGRKQIKNELATLAVCSDGTAAKTANSPGCVFPATRLIDGGYTDNGALALLVAYMQRKHGMKTLLELMLQYSNECKSTEDCTATAKKQVSVYFDSPAGKSSWNSYSVPGVNVTLPAQPLQIFQQTPPELQKADANSQYNADFSYVRGQFTTVENRAFGVRAGSTVNLIIQNANMNPAAFETKKNKFGPFGAAGSTFAWNPGAGVHYQKYTDAVHDGFRALLNMLKIQRGDLPKPPQKLIT